MWDTALSYKDDTYYNLGYGGAGVMGPHQMHQSEMHVGHTEQLRIIRSCTRTIFNEVWVGEIDRIFFDIDGNGIHFRSINDKTFG